MCSDVLIAEAYDQLGTVNSCSHGGSSIEGGGFGGVAGGRLTVFESGMYYNTTEEEAIAPCGSNDDDCRWLWVTACAIVRLPPDIILRQQTSGMSVASGVLLRDNVYGEK